MTEPVELLYIVTSISFDPEVLQAADTYRAELRRSGTVTTRSALVNAALLEYLQRRRAEAGTEKKEILPPVDPAQIAFLS